VRKSRFMAKKLILVISLVISLFVGQVIGQEFPQLLEYAVNMQSINPAFDGLWGQSGFWMSTRTNWIGVRGALVEQQFSCYTSVLDYKAGVGLNVQRSCIGRENRLFLTGDYSFMIRVGLNRYLRFGLRAGIVNFDNSLKNYHLFPDDIPDPEYSANVRLYNMATMGLGALLYTDRYFLSFSIPQIIANTFNVNRNIYSSTPEITTIYLSGGVVFSLPRDIHLRSNMLVIHTPGKSACVDVSTLVYFPGKLLLGSNFRSDGVVCFLGQYTFRNNIRIGYAVDYPMFADIRRFQFGSGEIVIGYTFNPDKRKYIKPTFF